MAGRPAPRRWSSFWRRRLTLPDDPRDLPEPRRRPGDRADPGRARLPLRLGWRGDRPVGALERAGSLRDRRGRLLGCARRQPARVQLPARGPGVLPADRRSTARGAPAVRRTGPRRTPTRGRRRRDPAGPAVGDDRAGRRTPLRRRADGRSRRAGRCSPTSRARSARGPGRRPTCSRSAPRWPRRPACARRPAGRTGARTSRRATTPAGPATSTRGLTADGLDLSFHPSPPSDGGAR